MRPLILCAIFCLGCGAGETDEAPRTSPPAPPVWPPGLTGVITDEEDVPIEGVKVGIRIPRLAGHRGWREGLEVLTAADGAFHLDVDGVLAPTGETEVYIYAMRDGYVSFGERIASYRPGTSRRLRELELKRSPILRGRVADEGGQPVARALVYALAEGAPGVERLQATPHTRTAEDGSFELSDFPAGAYAVGALAPGFIPSLVGPIDAAAGEGVEVPAIILRPGESISGTVSTSEGERVAGATVSAFRDRNLRRTRLFGLGTIDLAGGTAVTGAGGRFEISGLAPASYTVEAWAFGHQVPTPARKAPEVEPGATGLDLILDPGARISVKAVDAATGAPIPEFAAAITLLRPDPKEDSITLMEEVGAGTGAFRSAVLLETRYQLEVSAPGFRVEVSEREFRKPGTHEVIVKLYPR